MLCLKILPNHSLEVQMLKSWALSPSRPSYTINQKKLLIHCQPSCWHSLLDSFFHRQGDRGQRSHIMGHIQMAWNDHRLPYPQCSPTALNTPPIKDRLHHVKCHFKTSQLRCLVGTVKLASMKLGRWCSQNVLHSQAA